MYLLFVLNDAREWERMGSLFASVADAEQFFNDELGGSELWDDYEIQAA